MKKYIVIVFFLIACQTGYSQIDVNQLFKEFEKEKSANSMSIGKFTMSLASLFTETMGVDRIELFSLDECGQDVKDRFATSVRQLKDTDFETIVNSNKENSRSKILVKIKDAMIKEMVILTTGDSNAMVRIKGDIKPSDIERVINEHGNGR